VKSGEITVLLEQCKRRQNVLICTKRTHRCIDGNENQWGNYNAYCGKMAAKCIYLLKQYVTHYNEQVT